MNNTIKHLPNGGFEVQYKPPKESFYKRIVKWIKKPTLNETKF